MSSVEDLDSFFIQTGLQYEQIGKSTWVITPDSAHPAQIGVSADPPVVVFSIVMFTLGGQEEDHEGLFRCLLELNAELLHSSYSLQGDRVVLSGAQQLENLDFNEFQAMIDDMCMALDNHWDKLATWGRPASQSQDTGAAAEGSA
ncbi:MAG: hypothetical protein H6712_10625 [Myxococcales bacterium]|nr:hypothetical protein [Myxococcales bacterium]MCB9714303.1 hypothetical protein [Myxococcales bacterium]